MPDDWSEIDSTHLDTPGALHPPVNPYLDTSGGSRGNSPESGPHRGPLPRGGGGWGLTPPPIPLTTKEMDAVYELPYQRVPHPAYGQAKIPAYEMIRFSIAIQRGCFGGCTFCLIT